MQINDLICRVFIIGYKKIRKAFLKLRIKFWVHEESNFNNRPDGYQFYE